MVALAWIAVFIVLIGGLIYLRTRENRYLKKKTRDAIRPELRREFEAEVEDAVRRKSAFQDSLKKFGPPSGKN